MSKLSKLGSAVVLSLSMVGISQATILADVNGDVVYDVNGDFVSGIYETDVGNVDTLLGVGAKQGSPKSEYLWVNGILNPNGIDVKYVVKDDPVSYYGTNVDDVFAFATGTSDYFLIKNAEYIALYQNLASTDWGVFQTPIVLDGVGDFNLPDTGSYTISHVTYFDGSNGYVPPDDNPVPEPGSLMLFGLGLLGLVGFNKRKNT